MTTVAQDKAALRRTVIARRSGRPESERAIARDTLRDLLAAELRGAPTVCGYLPLPSEPLGADLMQLLHDTGIRVLLPRAVAGQPLDWCAFGGPTRRGGFGIDEPAGPGLGANTVLDADVVLIPALAVDLRGARLGRGGGHYDRTLAIAAGRSDTRWIAVIFDDERVEQVPSGPFDLPVRSVATPTGGVLPIAV